MTHRAGNLPQKHTGLVALQENLVPDCGVRDPVGFQSGPKKMNKVVLVTGANR